MIRCRSREVAASAGRAHLVSRTTRQRRRGQSRVGSTDGCGCDGQSGVRRGAASGERRQICADAATMRTQQRELRWQSRSAACFGSLFTCLSTSLWLLPSPRCCVPCRRSALCAPLAAASALRPAEPRIRVAADSEGGEQRGNGQGREGEHAPRDERTARSTGQRHSARGDKKQRDAAATHAASRRTRKQSTAAITRTSQTARCGSVEALLYAAVSPKIALSAGTCSSRGPPFKRRAACIDTGHTRHGADRSGIHPHDEQEDCHATFSGPGTELRPPE